jgi:hypothetical protein
MWRDRQGVSILDEHSRKLWSVGGYSFLHEKGGEEIGRPNIIEACFSYWILSCTRGPAAPSVSRADPLKRLAERKK